ncbi:hypothetical protein KAW04_01740 [Candidatus Bathyarchaeota archaeon]|nr:hypothetical protein [Candidatus Bathyarchaeota archaeon]
MKKRSALLSLAVAILIVMGNFLAICSDSHPLACLACEGGVVDKTPCEIFTVTITFKNTGKTEGSWSINIAFEDEAWSWSGTPQTLTLKRCHKKTLTWTGTVPEDAPIGSVARLIVYFDDSFEPLGWWIHVIDGAELTITSSMVK